MWLQNKLDHESATMWSIVTEESLKKNKINGEMLKGSPPLLRFDNSEIGPETKVGVKSMQT